MSREVDESHVPNHIVHIMRFNRSHQLKTRAASASKAVVRRAWLILPQGNPGAA